MAAPRRKQDDKNLEILREIITLNSNKYCFDCNQRGPTYVNTTIGSFVCSKCSGMLRGLTPPHRIKSISMATFTPEEIELIRSRGNDYCRRVWLGLYEGESSNVKDEQSIKDFMSDKYEKKRYYLEPSANSQIVTNGNLSKKSKSKSGPLISISPQVPKAASTLNNGYSSVGRPHNNKQALELVNNNLLVKTATITNTNTPSTNNNVPEFPVDFSNANIYNGSQQVTNSIFGAPTNNSLFNSTLNNNTGPTNDRYAALADLDMALRQQNIFKNTAPEESPMPSKNPFQTASSADIFSNHNPFFNGWAVPEQRHVNPFAPTNTSNSKNPFL